MNAAMVLERSRALGAGPYERTDQRQGYANGFKPRSFQTRMGDLQLQIPQVRGISFYPGCLEKGQRSEQALKVAVAEMYLNGVSTRKVTKITEQLCGFEISSSQVSRVAQALDKEVGTFLTRPLGEYSVVYLDARYEKVRHAGHLKNLAVIWAVGIDELGKRQVLGVSCKLSEAEIHWRDFLTDLVTRGLRGVHLIVSDAHQGLRKAREAMFPTVPWQRCMVHLMR
ncbi:MAG TPA: IS256 family transposase, partial [Candidatus Ozemobacteraceae bacterium]|nr:IS256 family transposase [Candidatus Ozemobacteraceae bacterium]